MCSFIPLLGALIAGAVATVVVLVTLGPVKAVVMLGIFIAVMNIEANVLQPLLLGRAVEIHPLIVLLGISAGAIIAGIPGAFFAIPLVAFITGSTRGAEGVLAQIQPRRRPTFRLPARPADQGAPDESPQRPGSWFRLPRPPSRLDS